MEAKTVDDLWKQYLDEHYERYRDFTKLLITLAGISIPLLLTVASREQPTPLLLKLPILGFLLSLGSGVLCQHQIMKAPLQHLDQLVQAQEEALKNAPGKEQKAQTQRRLPSTLQRCAYSTQVILFVLSFVLVVIHFV